MNFMVDELGKVCNNCGSAEMYLTVVVHNLQLEGGWVCDYVECYRKRERDFGQRSSQI